MPGILPMKVIRVGSSAQNRIAQACDRCRSKKIRCDGVRPCCSQCANVGFECRTSDKLSRRAFPRGYTESLEERVRALEAEIRELKDLLDDKDEKIDMLSKMHSHSSFSTSQASPPRRRSSTGSRTSTSEVRDGKAKQEIFRPQQLPSLISGEDTDPYFMGTSSGRAFVGTYGLDDTTQTVLLTYQDTFKRVLRERGTPELKLYTRASFPNSASQPIEAPNPPLEASSLASSGPSRMISDQLINIYFQEWAPLFPVLHRPTFLRSYENYTPGNDGKGDQEFTAQLYLIFSIAAVSATPSNQAYATRYEKQWQAASGDRISRRTLGTLQCLILAQMYCIAKGDYPKLLHYKSIAVGLSYRLGLHQSPKHFSLGALTGETRKKVFWTLYTLDCFSAALMGLPKIIKEEDVQVEYPVDADDEYVLEEGFLSVLPGEFTKLSCALALFRLSRVLSKVLEEIYPSLSSHEVSLQTLNALEDALNAWSDGLAHHLKLQFSQDKPSTNVTGSRSPLLSLAYYYIRTLIHRPAVCSNLGSKATASVVALGDSSKHIIQIVQLLEERGMSFSFCLNKHELLVLSGLGMLFQGLDHYSERKLCKVGEKLIASTINILDRDHADGANDFEEVARSMISSTGVSNPKLSGSKDEVNRGMLAPYHTPRRRIESSTSQSSASTKRDLKREEVSDNNRRGTVPAKPTSTLHKSRSHSELSPAPSRSEPSLRPPPYSHRTSVPAINSRQCNTTTALFDPPNLDYLSLPTDLGPTGAGAHINCSDKRHLETTTVGHQTDIFNNPYAASSLRDAFDNTQPSSADSQALQVGWPLDIPWDTALYNSAPPRRSSQRVMSHSNNNNNNNNNSLTSTEGLSNSDHSAGSYAHVGGGAGGGGGDDSQGILMPNFFGNGGGFTIDGLDGTFGH
ncbi:MAG: hypothetical protein M1835_000677 [Candelina submexicana]|nr:MAG: hypothetical protein M1835_000677 [Candelina submexicana]